MVANVTQKPILSPKEIKKNSDININRKETSKTKEPKETQKSQRELKIEKIKEMIKKGEYKIDIDATAKKIAEDLL